MWARRRCATGGGVDRAGPALRLQFALRLGRNGVADRILGLVSVIVFRWDLRPRNPRNQDQAHHGRCGAHKFFLYRYDARRQSRYSSMVPARCPLSPLESPLNLAAPLAFGVKRTWRLHQRGMSSFGPKHEPTAIFRAHGRAVMPSQRCKVIIGLRTRGLIARCILVSLLTMGTRFTISVFKRHRAQSHFNLG